MAYYTVWLANGQRFHVYARSSQDATRLVKHYLAPPMNIDRRFRITRVEYIRAVQRRPHAHHWSKRI